MNDSKELFNWSENGKYATFSNLLLKNATFWERNKVKIITTILMVFYVPFILNGSQSESKKTFLVVAIVGYAVINLSVKFTSSIAKTNIHVYKDRIERKGLSRTTYCAFKETSGFQMSEILLDNKKTNILFLSNGPAAEFFILSDNTDYNKTIKDLLINNGVKPQIIYQSRT